MTDAPHPLPNMESIIERGIQEIDMLRTQNKALVEACKESFRYFVNRPGNEELQLAQLLGAALAKAQP